MQFTMLPEKFRRLSRFLLPLALLPLAACDTLSPNLSIGSTGGKALICKPATPIHYSSTLDTPETVQQVRLHNKVYSNLHCPGF